MANKMHVPIFIGAGRLRLQRSPHPCPRCARRCACAHRGLRHLRYRPEHPGRAASPQGDPGIMIGHEGVGVVDQVGPAVQGLAPGDRVVIANRLTCGKCAYCRRGLDNQCTDYQTIGTTVDGAFAPYLRAPARALWKIAPQCRGMTLPFSSRWPARWVRSSARLSSPATTLPSSVGAHGAALRPHLPGDGRRAGHIVDVAPYRLEFAQELGMDAALNASQVDVAAEVKRLTGLGADIVVDAVGNQLGQASSWRGAVVRSSSSACAPTTARQSTSTPSLAMI